MPFEYYDVEDELVSIVQAKITDSSLNIEVAVYPDSEDEYKRAVVKTRILIGFVSASVASDLTTNQQAANETLSIICLIQAKKKRGDTGCHHVAKLLQSWLAGVQTTHCGRLKYKSYKGNDLVYDSDNGVWSWDLEFSCDKLFVQTADDEISGDEPILNEVILNDQVQ